MTMVSFVEGSAAHVVRWEWEQWMAVDAASPAEMHIADSMRRSVLFRYWRNSLAARAVTMIGRKVRINVPAKVVPTSASATSHI